eukprot:CAMPEP_0201738530 /NCGR_PEP_ID=MMETSP0593-20130828/45299_1 /ASSEMBLY_ACC=CAM_ASM_000672 /TAXON_ID=267983 /ORGANISM="Skeletonema japonicum, Strain CCMP2506" /LENGTH=417 /DNA_ID=CAMNT_0048232751 /DNA_START=88 /DNA_END=1341 /DNA_ORIENTATION=-
MSDQAITVTEEAGESGPHLLIDLLSSEELMLDTVDLRPSTFTSSDIRNIMLPLMTNKSVRVLYLPIDKIDLVCTKAIMMMLENNVGPPIEELHVSNLPAEDHNSESGLSRKISSMIISSLKQNKHIKKLLFTSQDVLHQSVPSSIAAVLYDNTVLKSLILRGCGISHAGATKISCALANNTSITALDLSNNPLSNKGICSVALALELNSTIQKLKLSGTDIGREGGEAMVEALSVNKSLQVLDMSRNELDDHVITKLARSLKQNKTLRQLSLRSNSFSAIGAICLSFALYDSANLQTVLECNHTLQYLDIGSNRLSRDCIKRTQKALRWNNLSNTENEVIRKKVPFFLLESECNCLCFIDHFKDKTSALDKTTVQHLLPNILWSVNNSTTVLYYMLKNLAVDSIIANSCPGVMPSVV